MLLQCRLSHLTPEPHEQQQDQKQKHKLIETRHNRTAVKLLPSPRLTQSVRYQRYRALEILLWIYGCGEGSTNRTIIDRWATKGTLLSRTRPETPTSVVRIVYTIISATIDLCRAVWWTWRNVGALVYSVHYINQGWDHETCPQFIRQVRQVYCTVVTKNVN